MKKTNTTTTKVITKTPFEIYCENQSKLEHKVFKFETIVNGVKVVKEVDSDTIDFNNRCKARIKAVNVACDRVNKPAMSKVPVNVSPIASWAYTDHVNPKHVDTGYITPTMALDNLVNERCNNVARGAVYKSVARGKLDFIDESMHDEIMHDIICDLYETYGASVLCSELNKNVWSTAYKCINNYVYRYNLTWDAVKRARLKEWHESETYRRIVKNATLTARESDMLDCFVLGLTYESIVRRSRQYKGRKHDRKMTRNEYDNQKAILVEKIAPYLNR